MSSITDKSILIIGRGLIGGSIARGLKQANPNQAIAGIAAGAGAPAAPAAGCKDRSLNQAERE